MTRYSRWLSEDHRRTVSATRGLLATDHVILNHDQVMRMAPKLAAPSFDFHTSSTERRLSFDRFNMPRSLTRRVFSDTGLELMTNRPRARYLGH
ncbi:hypothetical protein TNCV_3358591 [Trichonephila clavipes]|nr:hypothetical protein TNCV_3358591 [Trichonephila clavipes]